MIKSGEKIKEIKRKITMKPVNVVKIDWMFIHSFNFVQLFQKAKKIDVLKER